MSNISREFDKVGSREVLDDTFVLAGKSLLEGLGVEESQFPGLADGFIKQFYGLSPKDKKIVIDWCLNAYAQLTTLVNRLAEQDHVQAQTPAQMNQTNLRLRNQLIFRFDEDQPKWD